MATAVLLGGALVTPAVAMAGHDRDTPEPAAAGTSAAADSASVQADIDGDGGPELITVRERGDHRVVSARFADHSYVESAFPSDTAGRLHLDPRVADLGRDGTQELVVTTATGANTLTFAAFTYVPGQGLVRVTDAGGEPFTFHDGGGATALASYACHEPGAGDATFTTVRAQRTDEGLDGVRTRYAVHGDTVVPRGQTVFHDVADDAPVVQADPDSCSPT
ncbi:hypothetical protein [Prauserella aidingensis]|uniref:hypothetical protein n=1 Tax=Prauserella aidingensis TaxID=387890 RepID=UPI0020A4688B|nr:hypothetical protein [Prauserella aidingensis]